jgi:hypothetical protein
MLINGEANHTRCHACKVNFICIAKLYGKGLFDACNNSEIGFLIEEYRHINSRISFQICFRACVKRLEETALVTCIVSGKLNTVRDVNNYIK